MRYECLCACERCGVGLRVVYLEYELIRRSVSDLAPRFCDDCQTLDALRTQQIGG